MNSILARIASARRSFLAAAWSITLIITSANSSSTSVNPGICSLGLSPILYASSASDNYPPGQRRNPFQIVLQECWQLIPDVHRVVYQLSMPRRRLFLLDDEFTNIPPGPIFIPLIAFVGIIDTDNRTNYANNAQSII